MQWLSVLRNRTLEDVEVAKIPGARAPDTLRRRIVPCRLSGKPGAAQPTMRRLGIVDDLSNDGGCSPRFECGTSWSANFGREGESLG